MKPLIGFKQANDRIRFFFIRIGCSVGNGLGLEGPRTEVSEVSVEIFILGVAGYNGPS